MASHSDGNLTVWKDWRRIVPSHSTKYCKKSFLGLKKSPTMDFQGSVGVPAVARRPPVHMLMSRGLIVSSYFNLLHGNGGREGARQEGVWVRGRDEMRGRGMIGGEMKGGQRQWEGSGGGWGEKVVDWGKKKLDWRSEQMRDTRGQDGIINMLVGDDKIKGYRSSAGC